MRKSHLSCWLAIGIACPALALTASDERPDFVCSNDHFDFMRNRYAGCFMRYRYNGGDLIAPYVYELRTPAGVNILKDSPSDHEQHCGLVLTVAADVASIPDELNQVERQATCGNITVISGGGSHQAKNGQVVSTWGGCQSRIDWKIADEASPLLEEVRVLEVRQRSDTDATLLTWQSRLSPAKGRQAARITGMSSFKLRMHLIESMGEGGRLVQPLGMARAHDADRSRSTWCAYYTTADGNPVTVAMFDHPGNRRPVTWHNDKTRASFDANLDLTKPLEMRAGKPLLFRYGIAVWDGTPKRAEIEGLYQKWVILPPPDEMTGDRLTSRTSASPLSSRRH